MIVDKAFPTNHLWSTDHLWCVIPVYNNQETVKKIALECRSYLSQVLVVDDGSTDTDVTALFADTDITVLRHDTNQGKGQAILTALSYVNHHHGRFMITIDADGQHFPRDLEKFIPLLQDDEPVIVIGCRRFEGENIPSKSHFGRKLANFWLRVETGVSIDDGQSGFRAYPVKYLSRMNLTGSHYDFETEILAKAVWSGLHLKSVEIEVWYPEPQFRVSSFRPLLDNFRISCMHTRLVARHLYPIPHRQLVSSNKKPSFDLSMIRHPVRFLKALLKENATPAGLAASAAVGMFLAVLPLIAVHTLIILYVATRLHLNKVMALSIQNLAMPPFMPMVCIQIGYYLRHGFWLTDISCQVVFSQLTERLWEWLLGSLIVAPIAAALVGLLIYLLTFCLQQKLYSKRLKI